jgi:hypothetical protein
MDVRRNLASVHYRLHRFLMHNVAQLYRLVKSD